MLKNIIGTETLINGCTQDVWNLLTDFKNLESWYSPIRYQGGNFKMGHKMSFNINLSDGSFLRINPKVVIVNEPFEFSFELKTGLPFVFDNEFHFIIVPHRENQVRLINFKESGGIIAPFRKNARLYIQLHAIFSNLNEAVRTKIEQPDFIMDKNYTPF
jgi:hypothetical protein